MLLRNSICPAGREGDVIMKWYHKVLICICVVIFSPIIILGICTASIAYLFEMPKNKKEYTNSEYFKDFNLPYKRYLLYSPEYRFYNGIKRRNLPIDYMRQESNGLEYFVFENILYLFPDFEQIDFNEEKSIWEADYDGHWNPFEEAYNNLVSKIDKEIDSSCIKLLIEREMFPRTDLNGIDIPECIFLTWSFDYAFENEDSLLKLRVPTNAKELFEMMKQTPDLCGDYYVDGDINIIWNLYDSIQIDIGIDSRECYLGVNKKSFGKIGSGITHWHPTNFEIYDEVCKIGKRGNVLVIRAFKSSESVLYMGEKENCPYNKESKQLIGKLYYLEAK